MREKKLRVWIRHSPGPFTHFHSPLKTRENNFRIHSCLFFLSYNKIGQMQSYFHHKKTTGSIFMGGNRQQNMCKENGKLGWAVDCSFLSTILHNNVNFHATKFIVYHCPSNCFKGKFIFNAFTSIKIVFEHLLQFLWPNGESMYRTLHMWVWNKINTVRILRNINQRSYFALLVVFKQSPIKWTQTRFSHYQSKWPSDSINVISLEKKGSVFICTQPKLFGLIFAEKILLNGVNGTKMILIYITIYIHFHLFACMCKRTRTHSDKLLQRHGLIYTNAHQHFIRAHYVWLSTMWMRMWMCICQVSAWYWKIQ